MKKKVGLIAANDDVRTLAALLGVEFKKEGSGDFLHSNQISVLNEQGEIVYKHFGLDRSISDVIQAVDKCSSRQRSHALSGLGN